MAPTAPDASESSRIAAEPVSTWKPTSLVRVLMGAIGAAVATAAPLLRSPDETNKPFASVLGASIRAVTASKIGVTVAERRGTVCVEAMVARIRSMLPLESLMPMMFGCWASSATISTGIS